MESHLPRGPYNYTNLKGSSDNLKGISSDLATVVNLEIIDGLGGTTSPAALGDTETLQTAHQGGGTFTYYGAKATTKELADSRGSSFDWVTATAQNGIKSFTLTDYGSTPPPMRR